MYSYIVRDFWKGHGRENGRSHGGDKELSEETMREEKKRRMNNRLVTSASRQMVLSCGVVTRGDGMDGGCRGLEVGSPFPH